MQFLRNLLGLGPRAIMATRQCVAPLELSALGSWSSVITTGNARVKVKQGKKPKEGLSALVKEAVDSGNAVLLVDTADNSLTPMLTGLVESSERGCPVVEVSPDDAGYFPNTLPELRNQRAVVVLHAPVFEATGHAMGERTLNTTLAELAFNFSVPGQGVPLTLIINGLSMPLRNSLLIALAQRAQESNINLVIHLEDVKAAMGPHSMLLSRLFAQVSAVVTRDKRLFVPLGPQASPQLQPLIRLS